jgi:hypothetical protein
VSPYTMEWDHTVDGCNVMAESMRFRETPLQQRDVNLGNPVNILWGANLQREWQSLVHVWSEWYREYYDADFPRIIIRFEGE